MSRAAGWRYAEAHALSHLGIIYCDLGDYRGAHDHLMQGLAVCREIDDASTNAVILDTLSLVCLALGKDRAAREYSDQAVAMQRQIGDRRGEGYSLNHLGQVLAGQNDLLGAKDVYRGPRESGQSLGSCEKNSAWIETNGIESFEYSIRQTRTYVL